MNDIKRYQVDYQTGLNEEQVNERIQNKNFHSSAQRKGNGGKI